MNKIAIAFLAAFGVALLGYSLLHKSPLATPSFDPNAAIDIDYYQKASYCNATNIANWNCGEACNYHPGMTQVEVFTNAQLGAQGYCGYDSYNNRVVAAFRGSSNIANWIANLEFVPVAYPDPNCSGCQVHQGFLGVLNEISNGINSCVQNLVNQYPSAQVYVTGHSLGGAVSTLAVLEIAQYVSPSMITFMNFGSPRVGNQAFVDYFMSIIPNGIRVVNYRDIVPHVPPENLYNFQHISTEVWMTSSGSTSQFQVCAQEEDPSCSDSLYFYSVSDHTSYFGFYTGC